MEGGREAPQHQRLDFYSVQTHTHAQGLSEHALLKAVDYLGSRGAGLLIATQKLMSEEKIEEREETAE